MKSHIKNETNNNLNLDIDLSSFELYDNNIIL